MRRRTLLSTTVFSVGWAAVGWAPARAQAKPTRASAPIPAIPLRVFVGQRAPAREGGEPTPIVSAEFIDEQLQEARALFEPHGLSLVERERTSLVVGALLTRQDRNALAAHLVSGSCNVFFVGRLRDVDDPSLDRMGVMWRNLRNLQQKYVIVSVAARPTTLAHELGHFLGNPHSFVKNNLMSYERDGGPVSLDASQGAIARRTACAHFASKELA